MHLFFSPVQVEEEERMWRFMLSMWLWMSYSEPLVSHWVYQIWYTFFFKYKKEEPSTRSFLEIKEIRTSLWWRHTGWCLGCSCDVRVPGWGSVSADLCGRCISCLVGGLNEHGLCQLLSCWHCYLLNLIQLLWNRRTDTTNETDIDCKNDFSINLSFVCVGLKASDVFIVL